MAVENMDPNKDAIMNINDKSFSSDSSSEELNNGVCAPIVDDHSVMNGNRCSYLSSSTCSSTSSNSETNSDDAHDRALSRKLREPKHGQAPLHSAAKLKDYELMDDILRIKTTQVNLADHNGNTALHFAVTGGKTRIAIHMIRGLLAAGADLNKVNKHGQTPLDVHVLTNNKDDPRIASVLVDHVRCNNLVVSVATALHAAIDKRLIRIACTLVKVGISINIPDHENRLICEKVDSKTLVKLICEIRTAPPPVTLEERNSCMKCGYGPFVDIKNRKRGVSKRIRDFFHPVIPVSHCNCYYCGMLFCDSCITITVDPRTVPPNFDNAGLLVKGKPLPLVCNICDKVLKIRHKKSLQRSNFFAKTLGYGDH